MDNQKILLIKLSPQFEEASRLIGAVIIGKILMTAFSRADTPEDKRKDFCLYCDEFYRFASSDFATLISESRKFRISTTLSHQFLNQLSEQNRASALACGNIICFRVSGDDAHILCRSFDTTPDHQIIGEEPVRAPTTAPIGHLMRKGHTNPLVTQFTNTHLTRLVTLLKRYPFSHLPLQFGCCFLPPGFVEQGKVALDDTLYQCMATGRADIRIPPLALFMFCGAVDEATTYVFQEHMRYSEQCFNGLTQAANYLGHPAFLSDEQALAGFLKRYARQRVWEGIFTNRIVTPGPVFVHLLKALRQFMALLAKEPILLDTGQYQPKYQNRTYQDMENQVARDLANAPNYTAKVKLVSGEEYVIRTKPPQETLTGEALTERIARIKAHMKALGVIRHYTEVEAEIRERQLRLLSITDEPEDSNELPPPDSFSLE